MESKKHELCQQEVFVKGAPEHRPRSSEAVPDRAKKLRFEA